MRQVTDFVANVRWQDLPDAVRRQARMCLLDNLGVTLAGALTRVGQITAAYAARTWPGDAATILLQGKRSSPVGAAFANGWSANAVDSDDIIRYAGHAGGQIFPVALALAEAGGMGGDRMLAALVAGYEVAHRAGRCWHDAHQVYQSEGSWGSVACAATAAHLMGLSQEQIEHALGIAEYHAPNAPMMVDIDRPAMVKHAMGWGTMNGVISAELAADGFTGTPSILGLEQYREWVSDIGRDYIMVDGLTRKRKGFACCAWTHGAAEGARRLVEQHSIPLDQIVKIEVETFHEGWRLGVHLPASTEEAQFNMAWPVAAMLLDGEVGPRQTLEHRLQDPEIRSLARRVEVVESDELNELAALFEKGDTRGHWASRVRLVLQDGREYRSGLEDGGFRFPPMTWDEAEIENKFRWLAAHVLDLARIDRLVEMAWHFEDVADVRALAAMLLR
ncbi:MAG TPA: MmgE/PrpD family protein [Anaerolineae bacterium]|nr:MmgE/PrpD family protein [Anaerolineae bacterium]